jgi:Ca2+-binding RTX toxin-like protein
MIEHLSEKTHEVFDNNPATSQHHGASIIEGDTPGYNFTNSLPDKVYPNDGGLVDRITLPWGQVVELHWPSTGAPRPAYSEMLAAFGLDFDPSINLGPVIYDKQYGSSNKRSTVDILHGGVGNDMLYGRTNDDFLYGDEDMDYLNGGTGNDHLYGGSGHDKLEGGAGADVIDGGEGSDTVSYASSSAAVIVDLSTGTATGGDATGDTLVSIEHVEGAMGGSTITGDDGSNILSGAKRSDLYEGSFYSEFYEALFTDLTREQFYKLPDDHIFKKNAIANAIAKIDNYYIRDSTFADVMYGGKGADILNGYDGNDKLYGGEGEDVLNGGIGADILDGGADRDGVTYKESAGAVLVNLQDNIGKGFDAEGDTFTSIEDIEGSAHNDQLIGNDVSNRLFGRDGNDVIFGGGGNDYLIGDNGDDLLIGGTGADYFDGGADKDAVSYKNATGGVVVNLQSKTGQQNDAQGDTYTNIENAEGSNFADTLIGDAGANTLVGLNGNDFLDGGQGENKLFGGLGDDAYFIRSGYQYNFVYENAGEGNDDARFLDRTTSEISLLAKYNGDDLIVGFNNNTELVHFVDWYASDGSYTVEKFYFNDGSGNYVTATAEALAAAATEITTSA